MISSLAGAPHLVSASIVNRERKIAKSQKPLLGVAQTAKVFPTANSIGTEFFFFFNFVIYIYTMLIFDNIYKKIYYCYLKIYVQALIKRENVNDCQ